MDRHFGYLQKALFSCNVVECYSNSKGADGSEEINQNNESQ